MRKLVLLFVLLAIANSARAVPAQSIVDVNPSQCMYRTGDNPALALTSPNESGWKPYAQWQSLPDESRIWLQCRVDLGALRVTAHPAVQINLEAAYQLFVNGTPIGGAGNIRTGFFSMDTIRQYPLSAAVLQNQPSTISLQITTRQPLNSTPPLEIHAGDLEVLVGRRASFVLAQSSSVLRVAFWYPLIGVGGLMLLGLFYYDRSRMELLYLSFWCADRAALGIRAYCDSALINYPSWLQSLIVVLVDVADPVVLVLFYFSLARRRVPRIYWAAVAITVWPSFLKGIAPVLPAGQSVQLTHLLNTFYLNLPSSIAELVISTAPFIAFWPYRQISQRMRPIAVLCMLFGGFWFFWFAMASTSYPQLHLPDLWSHLYRGLLETSAFLNACVLVGLLALLFRDHQSTSQERAELVSEMASAREIQHYLIPEHLPETPGIAVQRAYYPSREVGGDFFQILPDARDGSTLIFIGDVAGKGLKAGMLSALIVGAIRTACQFTTEPSRILALLNQRLQGRGLVTCLALRINSDGRSELANAGHLPPFINGKELELEGNLPLGADAETEFPTRCFQFTRTDSILLLSDGVVEARAQSGELFGFERTCAISTKSAEAIAQAAQMWGQEDDITVLTIRRVAVANPVN